MLRVQCECGMRYDESDAGAREEHLRIHDEWAAGVRLPPATGDQVITRLGEVEVLLVTNDSSQEQREGAARVAARARLDTPFDTPAYTTDDGHTETRVFVARQEERAVGLAVLRPRPRWGWWSWDEYDAEHRPATPVAPLTSWTVESIWTHPRFQQRGLAQQLLEVASAQVQQPIPSFGWRRPFTPSGEAFVRRNCPEGFWVPD